MRCLRNLWIGSSLLLILVGTTMAGAATTKPSPSARDLVLQVDAEDPAVRRAATLRLNSLEGDALPIVEKALADSDVGPEGKLRLQTALKYIRPRARKLAVIRARWEWEARQLHDAYAKAGQHGAAWDERAVEAIDAYCRLNRATLAGGSNVAAAHTTSVEAFARAVKDGCSDPLILSLYHLSVGEKIGMNEGPVPRPLAQTAREVAKGDYGPFATLWIATEQARLTHELRSDAAREAMRLLGAVAAMPNVAASEVDALAAGLMSAAARGGPANFMTETIIADGYAAAAPGKAGPLYLKGWSLMDLALRYVSSATMRQDISGPTWQVFSDKLAEGGTALEQAWQAGPTQARIAAAMITVQLATGSRPEVERWFSRALEADPDSLEACSRKLAFLSPRWYGDPDEMIKFGRECLLTENWRGGIPMLLAVAHRAAADASGDVKTYYARPAVWDDLSAVYEGQLLNFPEDIKRRSEFIIVAARAEKWDVVRAQFEVLGDRGDLATFGGRATMEYYRDKGIRRGHAPANGSSTKASAPASGDTPAR
jgi:hypothetical protein